MPIDISSERLVSFNQAAKFLPLGSRPSHATWWRWYRHGVKGVRLESVLIGGRRFTSVEALERFAAATTAAANGDPPPRRTARQRRRIVQRARIQLERDGI